MRIGLLGGTFNPIHHAHLMLAECAMEQLALDQVWFTPTATPPHKRSRGLAPERARLAMVRLAVKGHPGFRASDLEIRRGGVSYSLETVWAIHRQHPRARLFFLIGSDMLHVPWRGRALLRRLCTFATAMRPSGGSARAWRGVVTIKMPQMDISSTAIRARIRRGDSVRYLVPEPVRRYLVRHRLYPGGS